MKKTALSLSLLALAAASPAGATTPEGTLKMPDYFVDYAVKMTVADRMVHVCEDLILNAIGMNRLNVTVEAKLHEDGLLHPDDEAFARAVRESLADDERMAERLNAVYDRIGINPSAPEDTETYCKAGRAEIAAHTPIGDLLLDTK